MAKSTKSTTSVKNTKGIYETNQIKEEVVMDKGTHTTKTKTSRRGGNKMLRNQLLTQKLADSLINPAVPVYDYDTKKLEGHKELMGRIVLSEGLMFVNMNGDFNKVDNCISGVENKGFTLIKATGNQSYMWFNKQGLMLNVQLLFARTETYTPIDDPARSNMICRLNNMSEAIDICRAKIVDYEGDGQLYMPKNGKIARQSETINNKHVTFYPLKYNSINISSWIGKGVLTVMERNVISKDDLDNSVDMYINTNTIKIGKAKVGSIVRVLLFKQGNSLESRKAKPMVIPTQSVIRNLTLMTPEGFQMILDLYSNDMGESITKAFSSGRSLLEVAYGLEGIENNDMLSVAEECFRKGLPVAVQTMDKIAVTVLKNLIKIKTMSRRVYAITAPDLEGTDIRINHKLKKQYPIGSIIEFDRSPNTGTEWGQYIVTGYCLKAIEVSQECMDRNTGDTDGDFLTIRSEHFIDPILYEERWAKMYNYYGGLVEDNIGIQGVKFDTRKAMYKSILTANQIPKADNNLTEAFFNSNGEITVEVLEAKRNLQAVIDGLKKDTQYTVRKTKSEIDAIYRILGGKYEKVEEFNELLKQAYKDLGSYEGKLYILVKTVLKAIPMIILPSQSKISKATRCYTWYEEAWMQVNNVDGNKAELMNNLRPEYLCGPAIDKMKVMSLPYFKANEHLYKYADMLVKKYKRLIKALAFAKTDLEISKAKTDLDQFYVDLEMATNPIVKETMAYLTKNILCGNPMKLIGSEKALFNIPLLSNNEDVYDKWKRLSGYEANYFVSTLHIKFED